MLNFRKVTIKDRDWITDCINKGDTDGGCYCFGNLFAWGESYSLEVAQYEGFCLMRSQNSKECSYAYPSGEGDVKKAILAMMDDALENGCFFRMHHVLENNKKTLEELFPDTFDFTYDRDVSEYVYSVKNMAELPGKKFHGKKGHVNAFFRNHTDVHCDPITDDNINLCLDIAKSWMSEKDDEYGELEREFSALEKSLMNFKKLGFMGAILFADGKAVAFTMGEPLKNNTFCTHYEKTLPDYRDAFPVINNGFTKLMLTSFEYVNREEDTGAEGLRKAKLSYHPVFMVDKYNAVMKNDPARKYKADETDLPELKHLWKTVFGDADDVIGHFIGNVVSPSDIFACRKDGKIVSAFYLVDAEITDNNKKFSAKYLYAAATLPEYRKQGIMSDMIKHAVEVLKIKGTDVLFLYPAEEKLYGYYSSLGFRTNFCERIYIIEKEKLSGYAGKRYFNSAVSYADIRETVPSEGYASFDCRFLDFARLCAKKYGGFETVAVFDDEDKVFIIGKKSEDGTVIVDEALSLNGNYDHILAVLADMKCNKHILKTPMCIELPFDSEIKKAGMLLEISDAPENKNIYLGQPCM